MEGLKGKVRPEVVRRAIAEADTALLKAAGRKGGLAAAKRRNEDALLREIAELEQLEDARQHEKNLYGGHPPEDDD